MRHRGMENVRLVNVDIYCVIFSQRIFIYIILNRSYLVIDKKLFSQNISRKASYSVVNSDNIRVKAADKIIQCV